MSEGDVSVTRKVLIGLSPAQMTAVYTEIRLHHQLVEGRKIKYVDSHYDIRTNEIFTVQFRGWGPEPQRTFTTTNRFDTNHVDLFKEIMDWLVSGREPFAAATE